MTLIIKMIIVNKGITIMIILIILVMKIVLTIKTAKQ